MTSDDAHAGRLAAQLAEGDECPECGCWLDADGNCPGCQQPDSDGEGGGE